MRKPLNRARGQPLIHHYDFYSQFLAKIERGHDCDLADAREMIARGLVDPARALELFDTIRDQLYRYPAISPSDFSSRLFSFLG